MTANIRKYHANKASDMLTLYSLLGAVKLLENQVERITLSESCKYANRFITTLRITCKNKAIIKCSIIDDIYNTKFSWEGLTIIASLFPDALVKNSIQVLKCDQCGNYRIRNDSKVGKLGLILQEYYSFSNTRDELDNASLYKCEHCKNENKMNIEDVAKQEKEKGYIYGYYAKEINMIKIGKGYSVEARRSYSANQSPVDIQLFFTAIGYTDTEKWMHNKFKNQRRNGEWFIFDGELKSFIMEHTPYFSVYKEAT